MGFRSTITGQYYGIKWPDWFTEKYKDKFILSNSTLISSRYETKFYDNELFNDIHKAIDWETYLPGINVIYAILHEDGVISKVAISKDKIEYTWMDELCDADHVWCQG